MMIRPLRTTFFTPTIKLRRLSILLAVHDSPNLSQHKIARLTHLSSSMVNNYIRTLHQEGLIHVTGATNRTQRYHLTPEGRVELFALILLYSTEIIQLYGAAKRALAERLLGLHSEGIRTIALFGAAETAEVVHAALKGTPLSVVAVVDSDPSKQGKPFNGLAIQAPAALKEARPDAVVITSFAKQEEIHESILQVMGDGIKVRKLSDF